MEYCRERESPEVRATRQISRQIKMACNHEEQEIVHYVASLLLCTSIGRGLLPPDTRPLERSELWDLLVSAVASIKAKGEDGWQKTRNDYTDEVLSVFNRSAELAESAQSNLIESEHVWRAVLEKEDAATAAILKASGVVIESAREVIFFDDV